MAATVMGPLAQGVSPWAATVTIDIGGVIPVSCRPSQMRAWTPSPIRAAGRGRAAAGVADTLRRSLGQAVSRTPVMSREDYGGAMPALRWVAFHTTHGDQ